MDRGEAASLIRPGVKESGFFQKALQPRHGSWRRIERSYEHPPLDGIRPEIASIVHGLVSLPHHFLPMLQAYRNFAFSNSILLFLDRLRTW